ncbi:MAG: hypothetical protein L3K18_06870 [Thermoplasmata archaeon]|nr:hypothetical protein [Thermoplasmata archaeon]MCI4356846.1 hypothetical protein [Thermoplasmata archaeon]
MAKRKSAPPAPPATPDEAMPPKLADDNFVATLREELARSQKTAEGKGGEDLAHRGELNKRLLQDLWEVHNQFEQISVHLTVEPSQTLFATFVEYPEKWSFRDSFDFGAVKTIELHDRTPGWVGFTLRFWFYRTPEGVAHLRGIYEWCEGESYHKYTGWMRMMNQAVLYDTREDDVNLRDLHAALRDLVVRWYTAHLERSPDSLIAHLKEKFPKGVTYAKESYRD